MSQASGKPLKRRQAMAQRADQILKVLRLLGGPASAYDIQAHLASTEYVAATTIYRALDHLIAEGLAHKLESLNAYLACTHGHHRGSVVFAICEECGGVTEFCEPEVKQALDAWSAASQFEVNDMTLEMRGSCMACMRETKLQKKPQ
jgi:Fur family zinc uptake transcriptional regulator